MDVSSVILGGKEHSEKQNWRDCSIASASEAWDRLIHRGLALAFLHAGVSHPGSSLIMSVYIKIHSFQARHMRLFYNTCVFEKIIKDIFIDTRYLLIIDTFQQNFHTLLSSTAYSSKKKAALIVSKTSLVK